MNDYHLYDDETLLSLLKQDDELAYTALYNRYWERMVTFAYVKLQSGADAKEVVQDVFLDMWNRRYNLQIPHNFHAYIAGSVKYKIFTLLAKRKKELSNYQELQTSLASTSTEEWLSYDQLREDLEKAVLQLPEKCRLVFKLSRESGLSTPEIARHLQISPKTVENHLTKALFRLRKALKLFFDFLF